MSTGEERMVNFNAGGCWWSGAEAQDSRSSDYGMSLVQAQAMAAVFSDSTPDNKPCPLNKINNKVIID